jgi:hypothetical protein
LQKRLGTLAAERKAKEEALLVFGLIVTVAGRPD